MQTQRIVQPGHRVVGAVSNMSAAAYRVSGGAPMAQRRNGAKLSARCPDSRRLAGDAPHGDSPVNVHLALGPLLSLLAGILILVMPRLLNYIVAIYLILMGLVGLFGAGLPRMMG